MSKTKLESFAKQFIAFVKGDDAEALAQRVYRKRIAGLKTEIAIYEGKLVDKEEAIETAKEKLISGRLNNGQAIDSTKDYVNELVALSEAVKDAEDDLQNCKAVIAFLKSELDM